MITADDRLEAAVAALPMTAPYIQSVQIFEG